MEKISFYESGQKITGTLQYPTKTKPKNPAILLFHGWMTTEDRNVKIAAELTKLGYICLSINFRSHGDSEGERSTLSRYDYLDDCIGAYDFLKRQDNVDENNIGVIGSSFGSYMACLLSEVRELAWLILRVPANYPDEGIELPHMKFPARKLKSWREKKHEIKENTALRALSKFHNPVLIVESEEDEQLPKQLIRDYIHAVHKPSLLTHTIMPGAGHSIKGEKMFHDYLVILKEWLQKKV